MCHKAVLRQTLPRIPKVRYCVFSDLIRGCTYVQNVRVQHTRYRHTREHCETPMHKRRAALTCCISFCCSSMILFSSPLLRRWMWSKERASACTDTYIHTYISADQQPYCLPSFHSAHQCPTHIAPPTNTPPTNLPPQCSTHLQPL